ncbi:unnamed protein product [Ectocarpus sp. CCAP 1310/34]|nr:unnamed protein product [Ectocarpus sp. CCAP 1310/34]
MSGLEPLIPFAWGALRLTSSLLTAGFKKLVGVEDESNGLIEWSGDVVLKARDKSLLTKQQGRGDGSAAMRASEQHGHEVRRDLESVRASVEQCRAENMLFFTTFMSSIEATQHGVDVLRNGPLEEAHMSLKEFEASGDDVDELKEASRKARTALVTGSTLEIKFTAATITISAGYVHKMKAGSPSEAKQATVKGSLANVVKHFATIWADPSRSGTVEERKVLSFLLNVVSCVCVLPPENVPVLPELDSRLLPAFGALCASEPELRRLYPDVGGAAVKAMLEEKTMQSLFELATEVGADVTACTSKDGVIEILSTSERDLVPTQATACKGVVEEVVRTPLPSGKGPAPAVVAPIPAPPVGSTSTDMGALMALYFQTNGPPEKKGRLWAAAKGGWRNRRGWGTFAPLGDWYKRPPRCVDRLACCG